MANRKAAMEELLKFVELILPGSENTKIYNETLGKLSDPEFAEYMHKLASGEECLSLVSANNESPKLSLARNLQVAKKLDYSFFQRLWLTDPHTGTVYLTPIPYMVIDVPLRRQAQRLDKKVSIPHDNFHTDVMTGQATGPSKGASLSFPELQVLYAQGLESTIEELIKFRGGDEVAYRAMNKAIVNQGSVHLDSVRGNSRVKSTETLSTFLKAAHLDNNL